MKGKAIWRGGGIGRRIIAKGLSPYPGDAERCDINGRRFSTGSNPVLSTDISICFKCCFFSLLFLVVILVKSTKVVDCRE